MKKIYSLEELKSTKQECILAIGNFDGFHLGHQKLISGLVTKAKDLNLKSCVMTFNPHPKVFIQANTQNFMLYTSQKREKLLAESGIDYLWEIAFNKEFRDLSANHFIEKFIKDSPFQSLYLGHDFALGSGKEEAKSKLENICPDIQIFREPPFIIDEHICSSTYIRELIHEGKVHNAARYLGREFTLEGLVVKGLGIGQKELVPTANLYWKNILAIPHNGVYFTTTIVDGKNYRSITNIGHSPTVVEDGEKRIETHLLDYNHQIYSQKIDIIFHEFYRPEKKFEDRSLLLNQINTDIEQRRQYA